jgi:hypothetical protein
LNRRDAETQRKIEKRNEHYNNNNILLCSLISVNFLFCVSASLRCKIFL